MIVIGTGEDGAADSAHIQDTVQHVATTMPWLFSNPHVSPNIIIIEQAQFEYDDGSKAYATSSDESSSMASSADIHDISEHNESIKVKSSGDKESELRTDEDEIIRQKLSVRAYHLPGNNWCQDLAMYIKNNHLVFGLCCHHRLHPVKNRHRLVILLGSLAFGLIVTNIVYLWGDAFNDTDDALAAWGDKMIYNKTELIMIDEGDINIAGQSLRMSASQMGILWTLGSSVHSIFDFGLWHMIACGHCRQRSCETGGWSMAVFSVMIVVSITFVMVYFRAFRPGGDDEADQQHIPMIDDTGSISIETVLNLDYANAEPDLQFLYGYLIELFLSLFVYSPIVQTLVFSGVLGCGWMPWLGGRPRSLRNEEKATIEEV